MMNMRYKWIYLIPNTFTTFTLSAGFYSIIMATKGHFNAAALAILVAFFADGFDGFTARLTHTQSKFGAEYDSFSDLIAFGIAPAILVYLWSISSLGEYSWLWVLCYTIAAAIRLARFNTQVTTDKHFFNGLPSPIAAGMMSSTLLLYDHYAINNAMIPYLLTILTLLLTMLMVSTVRYYSIRSINSIKKWVIFILTLLTVIVLMINKHPEGFFYLFLFYIVSSTFSAVSSTIQR